MQFLPKAAQPALMCFVISGCCNCLAVHIISPPPKGGLGMSDVSPCLESQGCHLISLYYLLFICRVLLLVLSSSFFLFAGPFSCTFSRNFFNIFR